MGRVITTILTHGVIIAGLIILSGCGQTATTPAAPTYHPSERTLQ